MRRRDDAIGREDPHITTRQQALSSTINKGSVSRIIRSLGYSMVCATYFAWGVTVEHKTMTEAIQSCWHVLKLRERPSYPGLLQQTK